MVPPHGLELAWNPSPPTCVYIALATAGLACALYWAHALGLRVVMRRLATDLAAAPSSPPSSADNNGWAESVGTGGDRRDLGLAGAAHGRPRCPRWDAVGHAPWSNMYEFTTAFATAILGFYPVFERIYVRPHSPRVGCAALGGLALPLVFVMLAGQRHLLPLRPCTRWCRRCRTRDLLAIHVAAMIIAYSALSVSFVAGGALHGAGRQQEPLRPAAQVPDAGRDRLQVGDDRLPGARRRASPSAPTGPTHAWGRYWGWDPKETSALVTWLIYGVYLHMRGLRSWAATRSAYILVVGFGAVMFTYFVVNLWISGLHSYAGV